MIATIKAEFSDDMNIYLINGKILSTISLILVYKLLKKHNDDSDLFVRTI